MGEKYIIDGLLYDHYPDEIERRMILEADREQWMQFARDLMTENAKLRRELGR
jgi:hypothetical protein